MYKFCVKVFRSIYCQDPLMSLVYILRFSVGRSKNIFHHTHGLESEPIVADKKLEKVSMDIVVCKT